MTIAWKPYYQLNDLNLLKTDQLYSGYCHLKRYTFSYKQFDGQTSAIFDRELLCKRPAVCVLLFDPLQDKLVLIEQLRIGAKAEPTGPWILETVAGVIDEFEAPTDTARRETLEETGLSLHSLELIARYMPSPGASDEVIHLYCGLITAPKSNEVHGLQDEGEDILSHVFDYEQAMAMLKSHQFNNAAIIIGLQWLQQARPDLRAKARL